jgi:signal transduction histidine kinase
MARSPARTRAPAGRAIAADPSAALWGSRSGLVRVWALNVALGGAAAWLFVAFASHLRAPAYGVDLPGWALAALFFATEMCVVHFEFKREAHTFSLGEVALVFGLFFVDVPSLLMARILGSGAALVLHRRQHATKLGFNLANLCFEVVVGALVWHAVIGLGDPRAVVGWVAALAATVVASCCSVVLVAVAISLMEGRLELETIPQTMPLSLVVSAASASLGLIGATLLYQQPLALGLVMAPAALTFTAYRSYASIRRQRDLLEQLHDATSVMQHARDGGSVTDDLLVRTRRMFAAESAELTLFTPGGPTLRSRAVANERVEQDTVGGDIPDHDWARAARAGRSTLVARTRRGHRARAGSGDSLRDAMVAPVYGNGRVTGMLFVANRLSDVSTFDADELRLLETVANHMGVSLENARLIDELKHSLGRLTELNRMKDDFAASISHELRTPLTSIRGYVDLLLRAGPRLPASERRSMLESVDRQSEQLWNLIEDLLVASGVESPPGRFAAEGVCLRAVVERVVTRAEAEGPGDRFTVDLATDFPPVRGDAPKIERILGKLVDNAVKHSEPHGAIRVEGRVKGSVAIVTIEDSGPGIPAADRERIFDRFYQVDQSSTRSVGGAGLGLYICRRLTESLGGRVWLERSDASGSRFCLALATAAPERTEDALSGIRTNTK